MLVILYVLVSMPLNFDLFVVHDIAIAFVNSSFIKEKHVNLELPHMVYMCLCS